MTVTKREILKALEKADLDAVVYVDNGIDCTECRAVAFVASHALPENEHVSTKPDASYVEDGSIVLRLA